MLKIFNTRVYGLENSIIAENLINIDIDEYMPSCFEEPSLVDDEYMPSWFKEPSLVDDEYMPSWFKGPRLVELENNLSEYIKVTRKGGSGISEYHMDLRDRIWIRYREEIDDQLKEIYKIIFKLDCLKVKGIYEKISEQWSSLEGKLFKRNLGKPIKRKRTLKDLAKIKEFKEKVESVLKELKSLLKKRESAHDDLLEEILEVWSHPPSKEFNISSLNSHLSSPAVFEKVEKPIRLDFAPFSTAESNPSLWFLNFFRLTFLSFAEDK